MTDRLLDLFCGAGGCADGYAQAGFSVTGVDLIPQPDYPYDFIQLDALKLDYEMLDEFDVIHASPPCQQYSRATALARHRGKTYPDLYQQVKAMLIASGKPYIIENVQGSPIRGGLLLCGTMFNLKVFRHRLFESNISLRVPEQRCSCSEHRCDPSFVTVAGNACTKAQGLAAMGITRNMTKKQMNESIPPAYTEWIGSQLIEYLRAGSQIMSGSQSYNNTTVRIKSPDQYQLQLL